MAALAFPSLRTSSYTAAFLVLLAPLLLAVPQSLSPQSAVNITMANAQNYNQQAASSDANSDSLALYNADGQPWLTKDSRASHSASYSNQGSASNSLSIQSAPGSGPAGSLPFSARPRKRCARRHRPGVGPGSYGQPRSMYAGGPGSPSGLAASGNASLNSYQQQSSRASQAYQQQSSSRNAYSNQAGYGNAGANGYGNVGANGYGNADAYGHGNAGAYGYGNAGANGYGNAGTYGYGNAGANGYGRPTGYGNPSHFSDQHLLQRIGDRVGDSVGRFGDKMINSLADHINDHLGHGLDGVGYSSNSDGNSSSGSDSDW